MTKATQTHDHKRLAEAFAYTAKLHRGQERKGTGVPYISHLMAVASLVQEHGGTEDQVIAALLHDGPEDHGGKKTLRKIRRRFGKDVGKIVKECSDTLKRKKEEWRARKERYLAHLPEASPEALLVSLSDKVHNLRCIVRDYRADGEDLWERFNGGREVLWYYAALLDAYKAAGAAVNPVLLDEYRRTLEELWELDRKAAQVTST